MNINKANKKAVKLAQKAAKKDGWMKPTGECNEPDSKKMFWTYFQEEIEAWESTDHFQQLYREQLLDLTDKVALDPENKIDNQEQFYELFETLKENFWEAWAEEIKLAKFWRKFVQKKKKKKWY